MNPDIIFQDDMIITLFYYQWSRRYDRADFPWYEISWYISGHSGLGSLKYTVS